MRSVKRLIGVAFAAMAILAVPASSASAEDFHLDITNAWLNLGSLENVKAIDPEIGDPPATLDGTIESGTIDVPADGFFFPPKEAEVSPGIVALIEMEANDPITGTFDEGTGEMTLDASLKATVTVLGGECVISPVEVSLSTSNTEQFSGVPFEEGLEGPGAISGAWQSLPAVTGPSTCSIVGQFVNGPGGIWMSQDINEPPPPRNAPSAAPKILTTPPASTALTSATFTFEAGEGETETVEGFSCKLDDKPAASCDDGTVTYGSLAPGQHTFTVSSTNSVGSGPAATSSWTVTESPNTCPPGQTGTPPNCVPEPEGTGKLGSLKLKPGSAKVKKGKKVTFTATARNTGDGQLNGVKVCLKAPKKKVGGAKCVTIGGIAAGKSKAAKFKVKVKSKAKKGSKIKLTFKATSNGGGSKTAKGKITVK